jgi:hypothetical protein
MSDAPVPVRRPKVPVMFAKQRGQVIPAEGLLAHPDNNNAANRKKFQFHKKLHALSMKIQQVDAFLLLIHRVK